MSSFLILLAATASSALPQFRPTFQNFPQQLSGLQFPQRPISNIASFPNLDSQSSFGSIPFWFNPTQIGGPSSLPPWLRPTTDVEDNAEDIVNTVAEARLIDNIDEATAEGKVVSDDAVDVEAAQKAFEEYLKLCLTTGTSGGSNSGYSGSYSRPTTGITI